MPTEYERMRLSENQDDDAIERDELPTEAAASFERSYEDFYDDVKLRNTTKADW